MILIGAKKIFKARVLLTVHDAGSGITYHERMDTVPTIDPACMASMIPPAPKRFRATAVMDRVDVGRGVLVIEEQRSTISAPGTAVVDGGGCWIVS